MTADTIIAIVGLAFALLTTIVAVVVWLVRLEGKTAANALATQNAKDSLNAHMKAQDTLAAAHADHNSTTREEIVRLQEQIKHLTNLLERWLVPARTRRNLSGDGQ